MVSIKQTSRGESLQAGSHALMQYVLFVCYVGAFVFDYRSITTSGAIPQFAMLALAVASASCCVWIARLNRTSAPVRLVRVAVTVLTIVVASIGVALVRGEPVAEVFRNALPFLLFGISFLVVDACMRCGCRIAVMVNIMYVCAIITMAWRCFYGLTYRGVGLAEVRYNIVTPLLPVLLGCAAVDLIRGKGRLVVSYLCMGAAVVLCVLSLTRVYLVTFSALIIGCAMCWFNLSARGRGYSASGRVIILRMCGFALAGTIVFAIAFQRGTIDLTAWAARWSERVYARSNLNTRKDITLLTRAAESSGVVKQLFSTPLMPLTGCGIGAGYYWDAEYFSEVAPFATREVFDTKYHYPSHNMWLYNLFAFGLIGGVIFSAILIRGLLSGWRLIADRAFPPDEQRCVMACWLGLLCFATHSFTSSPFGERGAGLYIGILVALCVMPFGRKLKQGRPTDC